eukprot:TRINITY_DN15903_c0_g1_i1.p1 TRINITY_DN15903_c0_g1~~TRINITY_DN15903_c0_g1_i1.p1  ORF type:complete len:507 (+),score=156.47 TRINITY_DN15903_c0_g1_i1:103-1623(+)
MTSQLRKELLKLIEEHLQWEDIQEGQLKEYIETGEELSQRNGCSRLLSLIQENENRLLKESHSPWHKQQIYFDEENEEKVRGGTIQSLILHLIDNASGDDEISTNFRRTFFMTLNCFSSVEDFIKELDLFAKTMIDDQDAEKRCASIARLVKQFTNHKSDNPAEGVFWKNCKRGKTIMFQKLEEIFAVLQLDKSCLISMDAEERQLLNWGSTCKFVMNPLADSILLPVGLCDVSMMEEGHGFISDIWTIPQNTLMEQWTLCESEMFRNIPASQFMGKSWSEMRAFHNAEELRALIDRFNAANFWIVREVLEPESPVQRASRAAAFISMAYNSLKLRNFHFVAEVVTAFAKGPLRRLKDTMGRLPARSMERLKELQDVLDTSSSYKNYRTLLNEDTSKPTIPYLAPHLTDLTFIEDGNGDTLSDVESEKGDKAINFSKWSMLADQVEQMSQYQRNKYDIKPMVGVMNALNTRVREYYHFSDNDAKVFAAKLQTLSVEREARATPGKR